MNLLQRLKACALVSVLLVSISAQSADPIEQQDIFVSGKGGYHTYRIPSLIPTKKGTLLAFCEGRKNSASDTGDIDILLKRSTDNGVTWSEQKVIWDDGANTCGNPCAVVDQTTGVVWLLLTHNLGEDHESDIKTRKAKGSRTVWVSKSKDDGKTWSAPVEITQSTKNPSWTWYATGPGVGIQMENGPHKGRLVIPCDHFDDSQQPAGGSHIIYSDDHGKTWKIGGVVRPNMNECQIAELSQPEGALLLSMRNHPKGSNRAQSVSVDGGATWTAPQNHPQLIDPTCQASLIRYSWPTKKSPGRLLFSNPAAERRKNMTVRVSYDDGRTWSAGEVLYVKDAAYSCLTALKKNFVGCLYERGEAKANEKITFARIPIALLDASGKSGSVK